jgi:hypothetical protein
VTALLCVFPADRLRPGPCGTVKHAYVCGYRAPYLYNGSSYCEEHVVQARGLA